MEEFIFGFFGGFTLAMVAAHFLKPPSFAVIAFSIFSFSLAVGYILWKDRG